MIYKITPSVDKNHWFHEVTNQDLIKVPILSQRMSKCEYKTLGTSITNIPMSPPSQNRQIHNHLTTLVKN